MDSHLLYIINYSGSIAITSISTNASAGNFATSTQALAGFLSVKYSA